MTILTASPSEYLGNTLTAAAMHVFGKTKQRDINVNLLGIVSVHQGGGKWVDYDSWLENGHYYFLRAE